MTLSNTNAFGAQSYATTFNAFPTPNTTSVHSGALFGGTTQNNRNNPTMIHDQTAQHLQQHTPQQQGQQNEDPRNSNNFWENMNSLLDTKLNTFKDSLLSEVRQITEPIVRDVLQLKEENKQLKTEFATLKTKTKEELDKLKTTTNTKIAKLEEKNNKMCQIMQNHQQTIDSTEFEKRERNIIIRGIPEEDPPNERADKIIVQEVMDKIGIIIDPFPDTKRLGKLNPNNRYHRAILIQCRDKKQVDGIVEKAKQLGDLPETDPAKKIYIQRDLPPNIREGNYKLRQQLKSEKVRTENNGAELKMDYKKGTISRVEGVDDEVVIFTSHHPF